MRNEAKDKLKLQIARPRSKRGERRGKVMVLCSFALLFACWSADRAYPESVINTAVRVTTIEGLTEQNRLPVGQTLTLLLEIETNYIHPIVYVYNGFRIYSDDGAKWAAHIYSDTDIFCDPVPCVIDRVYGNWLEREYWYDEVFSLPDAWTTALADTGNGMEQLYGELSDSVFFVTAPPGLSGPPGMSDGFRREAWSITIDSALSVSVGRTLCVDTIVALFVWPNTWSWYSNSDSVFHEPSWDGPLCFEIVANCCVDMRGNINLDLQGEIDISDLTSLVGWMFKSGSAPPCMLEADVDGSGHHDLADVTHLVGYMFKGGPEPAGCP